MSFSGLILAAGIGTRLGELSRGKGKALFKVAGRSLILYAIDFMRALGATRVSVVGGYAFPRLQELLKNEAVELRNNNDYEGKGNIFSLLKVLPEIRDSFVMMNVDHIYNRSLAPVIRSQFSGVTAFCDFDRQLGADDMKVELDKKPNSIFDIRYSKLTKMSKQLTEFHGGYVGMTYVDKEKLEKYKLAAIETLSKIGDSAVVENILGHLAGCGELVKIGDISGYGWFEIDTPDEAARAEFAINQNLSHFVYGT